MYTSPQFMYKVCTHPETLPGKDYHLRTAGWQSSQYSPETCQYQWRQRNPDHGRPPHFLSLPPPQSPLSPRQETSSTEEEIQLHLIPDTHTFNRARLGPSLPPDPASLSHLQLQPHDSSCCWCHHLLHNSTTTGSDNTGGDSGESGSLHRPRRTETLSEEDRWRGGGSGEGSQ